jgi:hypothetical protein
VATAIQIEVLVDDKGVVQGVNRVVDGLNRVPAAGKPAFDKLNESENKARETALLLEETFGVRVPRALTKIVAATPGVNTAFTAAFKATAVIGFVAALGEVVTNFDAIKAKAVQIELAIGGLFSHNIRQELEDQKIDKALEPVLDQVNALHKAAELAGKDGFSQITSQLKVSNDELTIFQEKFNKSIADQFGAGSDTTTRIESDAANFIRGARIFSEQAADEQIKALRRKNAEELVAIEVQGAVVGKSEIEKLRLQLAADLQKIDIAGGGDPSAQGAAARAAQQRAIIANEAAQEQEVRRQALVAGIHTRLEAEAQAAKGEEQIRLDLVAKLNAITEQERQKGFTLDNDRVAAEEAADAKIRDLRRAASDEIFDAEQKAAVASVPQWEQANAQIVADFEKRQREIDQQLKDTVINSAEADQLRAANWRETNARMAQDYATQFENLYNDITTGGIGQAIQAQMRKFFFNILGQWAAALQSQRQQTASGGGLLGALLGSLGIGGGPGGAGAGTGPYGLPAGVASSFGDFGDFSTGSLNPSFGGGSLGGGSLSTASIGGDIGGSILGSVLNSPVGGVSSGVPQKQGGPLAGLLSAASLQKLGPAAILGTLMLASKGGNSAIAAGGLIAALGLGALYGPSTALTAAAAPFAPFLGPLAGGLIGFGVGTQHGPVAGALSGAGSGALTGFLAAGPIGGLIGGIVGGLVGLFSGIFGGGPSKHSQADKYINANILPAIQQELTNFEGFSTDYATAINDLDQLKSQSYTQMKQQFGTDATNDEWSKYVVPAVQQAEDRINADQAERNRRGTLVFGAPQFAEGGLFTSSAAAGLAILHDGETVMTRAATQMYGPLLNSLNASARSGTLARGGGDIHIHIHTTDAKSFDGYLRSGGAKIVASNLRRLAMEGHA